MVTFLAKPTKSERLEKIIDFLNANPIKYALTVNPTIYTSCIEQFWATSKTKTVNGEVPLQALVDGKKVDNYHGDQYYYGEQYYHGKQLNIIWLNASLIVIGLRCYTPVIGKITVVILVRDRCPRGKGNLPRLPIRTNIVCLATPSMGIQTGAVTPNRSIHNIRVHSQCK
ncbi:hypothetical protein Tco_0729133 [Tanacetum coccineum]|uniref:Transposase n=1 Tax=Tanacetum coccineum TaxID=301880 RepID=A0ABQ4YQR1_9ASTR